MDDSPPNFVGTRTVLEGCPEGEYRYLDFYLHFILREDDSGNYRECEPPIGCSDCAENGYVFAEQLFSSLNWHLCCNYIPDPVATDQDCIDFWDLDIDVQDPVYPSWRYRLKGVYFHRDDDLYSKSFWSASEFDAIAIDPENSFNIVLYDLRFGGATGYVRKIAGKYGGLDINRGVEIDDITKHGSMLRNVTDHEIGHLLGLYHTFQNDGCDDTMAGNGCWNYDADDPHCDEHCEQYHNVMDYNAHQNSITQCQYEQAIFTLETEHKNRIGECNSCDPTTAFLTSGTSYNFGDPIIIDGTGSWKETSYTISVCEIPFNSIDCINHQVKTFSGSIGLVDLTDHFDFYNKKSYKVILETENECSTDITETSFSINDATHDPALPTLTGLQMMTFTPVPTGGATQMVTMTNQNISNLTLYAINLSTGQSAVLRNNINLPTGYSVTNINTSSLSLGNYNFRLSNGTQFNQINVSK